MATEIKCPKCGNEFDIEEVLYSDIQARFEKENQEKLNKQIKTLEEARLKIQEDQAKFEETKKKENELFQERVNKERIKIQEEEKNKAIKENEDKIKFFEEKLARDESKIKTLEQKEIEGLQLKNENDSLKRNQETEKKKYLLENSKLMIDEALKKQTELFELEKSEKDIQLVSLRKTIEDLKKQSDQGSMQTQGEALEVLLEKFLKEHFPSDEISEVTKGKEGADLNHKVKNDFMQECGLILYECKDAKSWNERWIDKLKGDMRIGKADVAVIVSTVLPKYIEKFGKKDGIWICSYSDVKIVSSILRDSLIRVHETHKLLDNVSDKKEQLYKYMTSIEFKQKWEAIIDTYMNMQKQLSKEKVRITKDWSEREKQLERMLKNSMSFIGDVKGIGGLEIPNIKLLGDGIGEEEE